MELSKETISRIIKEAVAYGLSLDPDYRLYAGDHYLEGASSEALRSFSEIEKLKEDYGLMKIAFEQSKNLHKQADKFIAELESQNKELMEALKNVYENVYAPEHGRSPSIESLLKSLPNKEA